MKQLDHGIPAPITSPSSMPLSTRPNAAKMRRAAAALESILRGRVDRGTETPEWTVAITETLSYLTDEELGWISHPRDGLATTCKYLPNAADIHDFLKAKRAKAEQFKPAHTHYHRLTEEHGPWEAETDFERKKRLIKELLGYDPMGAANASKRELVNPTAAEVEFTVSALKTVARPISAEFRAHLEAEGWFDYLESRKRSAA